ncbi:MAG: hypothetical protein CM15mP46_3380 [Alphaproteobacteria bacterium]|nr:MAG: hypothetical protein CM15mP46_3380 [Alphaproteobacteria bacterium]
MLLDEPWVYHSHYRILSKCRFVVAGWVIAAAETAYHSGHAPKFGRGVHPANSRLAEFVRGIYWLKMPGYADLNFFEAGAISGKFFWTGDTRCCVWPRPLMRPVCLSHHIQRLMVLGNSRFWRHRAIASECWF